jgi:ABC-2 type transport system permease protein
VISDIRTVLWKEWKEVFYQRGSLKKGMLTDLLLPVIVLGGLLPLLAGRGWISTSGLVLYVWMPPYLAVGLVANAFAGERERHTLETLLASRLSDEAILLGKMLAAMTYGVSVTFMVGFVGAIVVNVVFPVGGFIFFSAPTLVVMLLASLLLTGFVASAGTLASLYAPTVRQAAQRLSFALVLPGLVVGVAAQALPGDFKQRALVAMADFGIPKLALIAVGLFAALDIVLVMACIARFKRDSMIVG